jgi:molybdopterin/thiamine biosynthesis adenylyltransferase
MEKLGSAHVVIIGCGVLGSFVSETLVRAGVGKLTIGDRDYVEPSNLQRQQLFTEQDAWDGVPKVVAAEARLKLIREDVDIVTVLGHVDGPIMEQITESADLMMDATDNFETRLLINDIAWKKDIPWIYGACVSSSGTVFPFLPGESACFRCLVPVMPSVNETCDAYCSISMFGTIRMWKQGFPVCGTKYVRHAVRLRHIRRCIVLRVLDTQCYVAAIQCKLYRMRVVP